MPRPSLNDIIARSAHFVLSGPVGTRVLSLAASITDAIADAQSDADEAAAAAATAQSTADSAVDAIAALVGVGEVTLSVSTAGNDTTGTGTADLPVATIPRALELAPLKCASRVIIDVIAAGSYVLPALPRFEGGAMVRGSSATRTVISTITALASTTAYVIKTSGYAGALRRVCMLHELTGQVRWLSDSSATDLVPDYPFSPAPSPGDSIQLFTPGVKLLPSEDTDAVPWEHVVGVGQRVELENVTLDDDVTGLYRPFTFVACDMELRHVSVLQAGLTARGCEVLLGNGRYETTATAGLAVSDDSSGCDFSGSGVAGQIVYDHAHIYSERPAKILVYGGFIRSMAQGWPAFNGEFVLYGIDELRVLVGEAADTATAVLCGWHNHYGGYNFTIRTAGHATTSLIIIEGGGSFGPSNNVIAANPIGPTVTARYGGHVYLRGALTSGSASFGRAVGEDFVCDGIARNRSAFATIGDGVTGPSGSLIIREAT